MPQGGRCEHPQPRMSCFGNLKPRGSRSTHIYSNEEVDPVQIPTATRKPVRIATATRRPVRTLIARWSCSGILQPQGRCSAHLQLREGRFGYQQPSGRFSGHLQPRESRFAHYSHEEAYSQVGAGPATRKPLRTHSHEKAWPDNCSHEKAGSDTYSHE